MFERWKRKRKEQYIRSLEEQINNLENCYTYSGGVLVNDEPPPGSEERAEELRKELERVRGE